MEKNYTIKDIAELAGVSKGTVDRVIHKRGKVSKKAHEKVSKVLEEINYKPNLLARNLKNNKVYSISILVPNPEIDPYWSPCLIGVNNALDELSAFGININLHFFDPKSTASFLEVNKTILESSPSAVLMAPLFKTESLTILEDYYNSGIITSIFNNRIDSSVCKSFVGQDLHQSGRVAAKLLNGLVKDNGDLAIVHIDEKYENASYIQEKQKGFIDFFEGLSHKRNIITVKIEHPNLETSVIDFLNTNENIKGVFVTTSKVFQIAPIIEQLARTEISIVGYDLLHENIKYLKNGTVDFLIHQNPEQQAYIGLKQLAEHLLFDKEILNQVLLPIDIINSENLQPRLATQNP